MKQLLFTLLFIMISSLTQAKEEGLTKIFKTSSQQFISNKFFLEIIPIKAYIILGESHYTKEVHKAQATIIEKLASRNHNFIGFSTFWEFLNHRDQESISQSFGAYKKSSLSIQELFVALFPKSNGDQNLLYAPIMQATKKLNGKLYGTNAPRSLKRIITKKGLKNLDPKYIPYNMELGGDKYLQRFKEAMNGHIPKEKIEYYFQAQSYTDSVIAHSFVHSNRDLLKFLVIGSFHSDYNDGVVAQIKKISTMPLVTIKIIKLDKITNQNMLPFTVENSKYGHLADYLYFVE